MKGLKVCLKKVGKKMPPSAKKKRKKDNDDVTDLVHIRNELDQYVKRVEGLENERNHLLGRNAQLTEEKIMLERQLAEAQAKNESDVAKVEVEYDFWYFASTHLRRTAFLTNLDHTNTPSHPLGAMEEEGAHCG